MSIGYATYPNQRVLKETRFLPCNSDCKDNYYMRLNLRALENALHDLENKSSIKLFLYFSKNQENFTYAISSKHIMQFCNMSLSSYQRAFKELEKKGYLINLGNGRDYKFNQYPIS